MDATPSLALELFYCYARADKADRDELEQHLAGLKRKYHITSWSDQEIAPGTAWEKAIAAHLNTADVILLLVSARFMASDYCYGMEMERALARHAEGTALVIPVLLHPVYLGDAPFEKLQMLPTDAKAVSKWANRDEAFWDVTIGIAKAVAELLKKWPSKEEWLAKGNALWNLKRFEDALAAYEQAIRLDPSFVLAWQGKGTTLWNLRRFEDALAAFEQTIRLDPSFALAWNGKGNALWNLKQFEDALAAFEQAIRFDPSFALAWNGIGNALRDLNRFEYALSAYNYALRLDPNEADYWHSKGNALLDLNRFADALASYEQALRLDPTYEGSKRGKQLALERLGRAK